jgi:hypothetical protein
MPRGGNGVLVKVGVVSPFVTINKTKIKTTSKEEILRLLAQVP